MNRASVLLLTVALALATGCSGSEPDASGAPAEATVENDLVTQAAAIARAIEADPDAADAILESHGVSVEDFEQMMYEISADPALASAYEAALAR